jgi:hypothetical protein
MARYKVTGPNGKQYLITGPSGSSKEQILGVLEEKLSTPLEQPTQPVPTEAPDATFGESIKDIGVSALQGVLGAKEAITGIADIPTMGIIGRGVAQAEKDLFGGTSQDARAKLQELKSAEAQQEEKEIAETKGFLPTAGAYLKRPGALAGVITESIPTMLGGAGIARGVVGSIANVAGKKAAPLIAGAVGEGAITSGSIAESTRQESESGLLTPSQAGISTLAGVFTGGLGVFGGKVANYLKVGDIDTLMAGGIANAEKKSILKQALKGALSESVFEELPQSMQEQIMQNINLGRPPLEGVAEAGATGMLAGAFMGGPASALSQAKTNMQISRDNQPPPAAEKEEEEPAPSTVLSTEKLEDVNALELLNRARTNIEGKIDDQPKPTKPRKGIQVPGGPEDGAAGVIEGADGSGLVRDRIDTQSADVGTGTQPITLESLASNVNTSGLEFKNPAQLRKYLTKQVPKAGLAQLELESPTAIKDLFDQYKSQLETKPLQERILKLEDANKQARLKQEAELNQEQLDALPTYLKTVSEYAKEAPLTKDRGLQTAAVEEAFDTIDTADIKGLKQALVNLARDKTTQALADRKARIEQLMAQERITKAKATELIGTAEDYTYSSMRPTEFMTREELNALVKEYEGLRAVDAKGDSTLSNDQIEEAKARKEFINTLTEDEKTSLEQQKYDAINRELESNRQQVINEQLLKKQETQKKKAAAEVDEQIKESKLIPEIDTKPALETEGQILNKGTRIVNKKVNSAISNNKPFLDILKDVAGGEFNKYFSYQTVADMLQEKITTLAKPKAMNMKGMALPTVVYGTVEKGRPAKFDPATNTITIDPNNSQGQDLGQILTHESMHYMLDHIIDNRKNLSEGQKNALRRLDQLHKQVKAKLGNQFDIPNLKEFVAEAFTNSDFQRALASLRPPRGSKLYRTASDIVWNISKAIVSALGLRFNAVPPVVLEETIDLVSSIITDKAYTLPTETMMGAAPSFAPKQAGEPKPLFDPEEYKKKQSVKEYHKPTTIETVKRTIIGEKARDSLITKFQNSRYAIKKWQKNLQKAGLIKVLGDGFNNINDYITLAFGEANFRQKEYLEKPMQDLQRALQELANKSNKSIGDTLGDLKTYAVALHEPERRHIKFLKTAPLTPRAATERDAIFELVSSTTLLTTSELQELRAYLEKIVANNLDPAGEGRYKGPEAINEQSSNYNVTADLNSNEIATLQRAYQNDPNKAEIDNVLALLKPIQSATIQLNKMGNHWSQATDNITAFYGWQNYVPLKYEKGKMPSYVEGLELQDKRLSNELRESVGSFEGSTEESKNPIIQTMVDAALSAARAGRVGLTQAIKNAIEQKLLDGKVDPKLKFTAQEIYKGIPQEGQEAMRKRSSIFHYDKDGSLQILQVNDPQILESIRRTYQEGHPVLDIANKFTSFIGQTHTRYNPAFPIFNFVRDTLTNAFVMAVDMGPMEAFRYIGAVSASVANGGLFKANKVARLYANNDITKLRELAKKDDYVKDMLEFIEQGGIVSIVEGLSVQGQLSRLYKDLNRNKMLKTKEQIDKLFDGWVYTFELAARASAYSIAKKDAESRGATPEAAKQIGTVYAKQLANFEEVGEWGKGLGAMFVFFRPSATGAVRAFESLGPMLRTWESVQKSLPETITKNPQALAEYEANWRKQSRAASGVVISLLGAGATLYLMAAGLADDDDEGRNKIINDDLSRWTRVMRFDIGQGPNGEERVIQIPWGFGLGGFAATGAQIAGAMSSKSNSLAGVFGNLINIGIDSFIPIPVSRINPTDNFAAFAIDSITPSAVRPFLEYTMNMNSLGQEIYNNRQSRFGDAYTGGDNIPDMYKDASRLLADITGGAIDWSPNTMYFFANNYVDGLTRLAQNGYGIGLAVTGQKDFDPKRDLIIFESFLSNKSNVDSRQYGKIEEDVLQKQKIINMFRESNPEKYIDYIMEHPYDEAMIATFNKMAGGDLKKLREDANIIRRMPGLTPKDRAQMLEMNKLTQNLLKSSIVSSIEMFKDLED